MAHRATLRHEFRRIFRPSSLILSGRGESKALYLPFGKLTFNRAMVSAAAALAVVWMGCCAGCGTPAAPQPPSLNLPVPVSDLTASRTGNQVTLHWTMPRRTTDKLLLKEKVPARVCRQSAAPSVCEAASGEILIAPGTEGGFTETLPAALATGPARALNYFVELKNARNRSAGLSNAAAVLAGAAPAPVEGLRAELRKDGVVLHWAGENAENLSASIRLHRTLLNPLPAASQQSNLLSAPPEPVQQNLLIEAAGAGRALDASVRFGQTYTYSAQRVAHVKVGDTMLELAGELSAPLRIEVKNVFPPAVPVGLAAVASAGENGVFIDLSWQPDTESDLAGYIVYRRSEDGAWTRLTAKPSVAPAFHDSQVLPGERYRYAVSAIDQAGQESARSREAAESVPQR
jgi:hypothetical protein